MAEVTAEMVKNLRAITSAGMVDCKNALVEAKGDMDSAIEILRKKGLKDVSKREGRVAAEGAVGVYVHPGDQIVAVVELNSETDFVARGEDFKELARDIAMHIAAMRPTYLNEEQVPAEVIEKEKEIAVSQLSDAQKDKADKILPGKIAKFFEEVVLLNQIYVKDESGKTTIKQLVDNFSAKTGEKVVVRRFQRFEVGEGIEKVKTDLRADVEAMTGALN